MRGGRLGIEATVTRPLERHKRRDLPVEAENRAMDDGDLVEQRSIVDEITGREVVAAVHDHVPLVRQDAFDADPENKLLAVFPRKRLDAEQIRDSLLVAAGQLNDTVGGPSVFAPVPKALNAGNLWQVSKDKSEWNRRSLYIFTRRSVAYPLLETFDMASPQQVHSKRDVTTTPLSRCWGFVAREGRIPAAEARGQSP